MGDTWDVGSRPVSALLRGQLQLDELVTPHPGLDSASTSGHATKQQPPEQAAWQLHWDRVQGPVVAASTQSTRVRTQASAIGHDSASASGAGVAAAASPQSDAATSTGSSPVGASGQAPDVSNVQQCSSAATSAEDAAQEGQTDAAQQQGLHSAGKETAGGTACTGPEPASIQKPAEASPRLTADDEENADGYQEQQEEGAQDGDKALQQDEQPCAPSQPCGDADQGACTTIQQQQQQQEEEEEEEGEQQQQQQQQHALDAERAGGQEQACSRALSALRDSFGRAEAGAAWPLDYARLREHLQEVSTDPANVAQLLQALHWRLCATPGGLQRFDLITDWVQKDLLLLLRKPAQLATSCSSSAAAGGTLGASCLEQPSTSSSSGSMAGASSEVGGPRSLPEQVMASGSAACQLRLLRLLRAASCSRGGRAYLLQPHGRVLRTLLQQLRDPQAVTRALQQHYRQQPGSQDAASKQQDCVEVEMLVLVVSTLQKLALKRRAQSPLIRAGLVPWLVSLLAGDTLTKVDPECPAPVPAPAAGTAGGVSQSSSSAAAATSNAAPSSRSVPQQPVSAVAAGSSRTAEEADPDEQQDDDGQENSDEASDADQSGEQPDQPQQAPTAAARALAAAAAAAASLGEEDTQLPEATSPPAADADANAASAAAAAAAAAAADTAAGVLTSTAAVSAAVAAAAAPTGAAAAPVPQSLQAAHPQDLPALLLHSATALLLQLVLRSTGAAAAAEPSVAARLLDVAAVLLGTSEAQVHAYTNATLYALFSNASVCCLAVAKGLDKHLQQLLQQPPGASLQRQLQHVLARLQKRCPAAGNAELPSLAVAAAATSPKRVQGGRGAGDTVVESDDEARQDDDEDEPCEDLADLEQQLAADVQRGIQEAGISCTGASEAAAAGAAADEMLLGEQLLEASYPQLPDDPTITCVSPTATGRLSPTHPMMSSWGSWRPGSMLGAGAGAAAGGGGWRGAGGVCGGWSLPPAQWGTGTHVLQMSGSWGAGAWNASISGSSVGVGVGIAGQLQRGVHAAAQQTQHTLLHLQQSMTFTARKVSVAPAGPNMTGLGAAGGGVRQSLAATSPVPATSPTPLSRTVHW